MSAKAFGSLVAVAFIGGGVAFTAIDREMNYVEVDGKITYVKTDCWIKEGKTTIVEKGGSKTAYMDCKDAPDVAKEFGMSKDSIRQRVALRYQYKSPVDDSKQLGEYESDHDSQKYKSGQVVKVLAHKTEAASSQFH